jgi:cell division protein FtsA
LTRDVAIGLGLPLDMAEEMKKRFGSVMPVYESKADDAQSQISQDGHGFSYNDLCDILRARVEEIVRLILLELPRSDYTSLVPAGLVLTGGSSKLPGMDTLAHNVLRLPVRIGIPKNIYGISDTLCDPKYATSVGLLLWGAKQKQFRGRSNNVFGFSLRRILNGLRSLFR